MKHPFGVYLRSKKTTAEDLLSLVRAMYPETEDPDLTGHEGPEPHPVNAIAVVLLSAALLGTTDVVRLKRFTGYSRAFISAIKSNMENSRLWVEDRCDTSAWLSSSGAIDHDPFLEDVEVGMGLVWTQEADEHVLVDPCNLYWDEPAGRNIARKAKRRVCGKR
jgi:hypothetical protein